MQSLHSILVIQHIVLGHNRYNSRAKQVKEVMKTDPTLIENSFKVSLADIQAEEREKKAERERKRACVEKLVKE